jgi:hypothetical protein
MILNVLNFNPSSSASKEDFYCFKRKREAIVFKKSR